MREIKFRAWDRIENKILYPEDFYKQEWGGEDEYDIRTHRILIEAGGAVLTWDDVHGFCQPTVSPGGNRYSLIQYTGLKDKNGIPIYEGDILEASDGWKGQVKPTDTENPYNQTITGFKCSGGGLELRISCWRKSEVIGNIYENGELLE